MPVCAAAAAAAAACVWLQGTRRSCGRPTRAVAAEPHSCREPLSPPHVLCVSFPLQARSMTSTPTTAPRCGADLCSLQGRSALCSCRTLMLTVDHEQLSRLRMLSPPLPQLLQSPGSPVTQSCTEFLQRAGGPKCGAGAGGVTCGDRLATFILYLRWANSRSGGTAASELASPTMLIISEWLRRLPPASLTRVCLLN
jgi:hypothetical protein